MSDREMFVLLNVAIFLWLSMYAAYRLHRYFDSIDRTDVWCWIAMNIAAVCGLLWRVQHALRRLQERAETEAFRS